ncbi:hypothetical protein MHYP_G00226350 [Metynnis hypsauchen]
MSKRGKKRNFTECEVETLLNEVEARKKCLFGTLSSGITAKRKRSEWDSVCEAVNAVGSEHRGGAGDIELTPFDQRVAGIVGDAALTGVVDPNVGDSDCTQRTETGEGAQSQPAATDLGCSSSVPSTSGVTETSSAPHLPAADVRPTGRVLTTAVLQSQEEIVRGIGEINTHLKNISDALTSISNSIKELVKK